MSRLVRQVVVAVYHARFPTAPGWPEGPLPIEHGGVRADATARRAYYSDKAARLLYGTSERPRRWHSQVNLEVGEAEVLGVEAVRVADDPGSPGLIAIHLRSTTAGPARLLRTLARRRDAPAIDLRQVVGGHAEIDASARPFTLAFVTPAWGGLPRLYRHPRYLRWPRVSQWLWTLASRSTIADHPPDPKSIGEHGSTTVRISADWRALVLRDGVAFAGIRADRGPRDPFYGFAEMYARSLYLDALLLGILQERGVSELEERIAGALDSSRAAALMPELEEHVTRFRHQLWWRHLTTHGTANRLLMTYQRQHRLGDRFEQIMTEINDFSRLSRAAETQHINSALGLFTLVTVPIAIAVGVLEVLGSQSIWQFAVVTVVLLVCTALLLRTRPARLVLRSIRRRFNP